MVRTVKKAPQSKLAVATSGENDEVAIISTSDRSAFRSCRRKWNWQSHLRQGLSPLEQKHPLWFGSGFHHALEDLHGPRLYKNTDQAVEDYVQATMRHYGEEHLPESAFDDIELMKSMLNYYQDEWLKARGRDPLKTYKVLGEPQVEVPFEFEIPVAPSLLKRTRYKKVIYRGIIDRVVRDENGMLWLQDYKSVARFTHPDHLELDSQIGVYLWAASYIYRSPVVGFVYTQFRKAAVQEPRILKDGSISADRDQNTSHGLYRRALIEMYGDNSGAWPSKNKEVLQIFAGYEEEEADKFIRRDRVYRDPKMLEAEGNKILAEVSDMLDPDIRVYPSPSWLCPTMCSFIEPCMQMDRGEDYKSTLQYDYQERDYTQRNDWRVYLKVGRTEDKKTVVGKPTSSKKPILASKKSKIRKKRT